MAPLPSKILQALSSPIRPVEVLLNVVILYALFVIMCGASTGAWVITVTSDIRALPAAILGSFLSLTSLFIAIRFAFNNAAADINTDGQQQPEENRRPGVNTKKDKRENQPDNPANNKPNSYKTFVHQCAPLGRFGLLDQTILPQEGRQINRR